MSRPATLTIPEAADRLGVSRSLLYRLCRRGEAPVPPRRIGRRLVISAAELDRWIEGRP